MKRTPRAFAVAVAVVAVVAATAAHAQFVTVVTQSQDVATVALAPPAQAGTARGDCVGGVGDGAVVSWTTAPHAGGYEVWRGTSSVGPYDRVGVVGDPAATSYNDAGLAFDTVYYYRVRTTRLTWYSGLGTAVSHATRSSDCT